MSLSAPPPGDAGASLSMCHPCIPGLEPQAREEGGSQLLVSSPAVSMMDAVSAFKTRKERKVFVVFRKTYRERGKQMFQTGDLRRSLRNESWYAKAH